MAPRLPVPIRVLTALLALSVTVAGIAAYAQGHSGDAGGQPPVQDPGNVLTVGNPIRVVHFDTPDTLSPIVYPPYGTMDYNQTYDLTITAIDAQAAAPGASLVLVAPSGAQVGGPRQAYNDTEHCGQPSGDYSGSCDGPTAFSNVTFPNVRYGEAGEWDVKSDADGTQVAAFLVSPHDELTVSLSPSEATYSASHAFSLVITVTNATGAPVSGATLAVSPDFAGLSGTTTDSEGTVTVLQSGTPPVGDYLIRATSDVAGSPDGDVQGAATFRVVPAEPTLSIRDATAYPDHDNVTPVTLENASDLGTITFTLSYDPSVVAVANVSTGMDDATLSWNADGYGTLTVTVATSDVPGASGNVPVAWVTLHAVGGSGTTSALHLAVTEAAHSDGSSFATQTRDATFRSQRLGDVNGDGVVDLGDVQAIADWVVGKVVPGFQPGNADVNHDGRVTGVDAMMVRQVVTGSRLGLG